MQRSQQVQNIAISFSKTCQEEMEEDICCHLFKITQWLDIVVKPCIMYVSLTFYPHLNDSQSDMDGMVLFVKGGRAIAKFSAGPSGPRSFTLKTNKSGPK